MKPNRSRSRVSFLAALVSAAAAFGAVAATTGAASALAPVKGTRAVPAVADCGLAAPQVRPKSLTIACGDANSLGVHLVWSKWGATGARASGTYTWNTCVPYCAASKKWDKAAATFSLSKPASTKKGWLFEELVVHITGKVPAAMQKTQTVSETPR